MRLDVFTQVPHAFAWMTEQRPLAAVLGTELELRLFNYRDTTPLRSGQVDDEPYGGGAGMVLRVDVVAAALEAVYGGEPEQRVIALTPQGRPLTQAVVEELASEPALTLLSSRFEGFDERIVTHLCSDAISIGPYVLSGGELPAMVLLDAIAQAPSRRAGRGLGRARELLGRARRRARVPALHAPGRVPRLAGARRAPLRRPRPGRRVAPRAEPRAERAVSDREDDGGRDPEGWHPHPGEWFPPPIVSPPPPEPQPSRGRPELRSRAPRRRRRRRPRRDRAGASSSSGPTTRPASSRSGSAS